MRCHSAQPRKAGFLGCHPYAGAPDNHRDEDAGKGKRTNWSIHSQHVRPTHILRRKESVIFAMFSVSGGREQRIGSRDFGLLADRAAEQAGAERAE